MSSKRPLFIATADVHMQRFTHVDKRKMEWDAKYGLEQVINLAIDIECRRILMAGDNFNVPRPGPIEVSVMFSLVERAWRHGLTIAYVRGQHDGRDDDPGWLGLVQHFRTADCDTDRAIWLHKRHITVGDFCLYGLDWLPKDQLEAAMSTVPKNCDLMLMHQMWDEFMPSSDRFKPECSASMIPAQVRMVVTGDFHDHRCVSTVNSVGNSVKILSPGPVCMQNLAEPENKFCYIVYDDLTYESYKLKSRNCFRYMLRTESDLALFIEECAPRCVVPQPDVPDYIATNVVEVRYFDNIPECYPRLLRVLDKKVHHFLKPIPAPKEYEEQREQVYNGTTISLSDAVKMVMNVSDEAKYDSLRLIEVANVGGSISSELDKMRDEFYRATVQ